MLNKMETIEKKFKDIEELSPDMAKKIIDILAAKWMSIEYLNWIADCIERYVRDKILQKEMGKVTDQEIQQIIDEEYVKKQKREQCDTMMSPSYSEKMVLYSEIFVDKKLVDGDVVDIQIMKIWKRNHPTYGKFEITKATLDEIKSNFDTRERWIDLAVDENHEPDHKALGRYKKIYKVGEDALYATIKLTQQWAELLTKGLYKYFSPEIVWEKKDEESWKKIKNLLIWGAFTNRPFFKGMQPLMASEVADSQSQNIYFFNTKPMIELLKLLSQFEWKKSITKAEFSTLQESYWKLTDEEKTEEIKKYFEDLPEMVEKEEGKVEEPVEAPADDKGVEGEDKVQDESGEQEKTLEANEKWQVSIPFNEYESLKKVGAENAKLIRAVRERKVADKANEFQFSEDTSKGMVLPKNVKDVVNFALSLSEAQEVKFFELLWKMRADVTEKFKELWKEWWEFGEKEYDDKVMKHFMDKMSMSKEDAIKAAKDFAMESKKK